MIFSCIKLNYTVWEVMKYHVAILRFHTIGYFSCTSHYLLTFTLLISQLHQGNYLGPFFSSFSSQPWHDYCSNFFCCILWVMAKSSIYINRENSKQSMQLSPRIRSVTHKEFLLLHSHLRMKYFKTLPQLWTYIWDSFW